MGQKEVYNINCKPIFDPPCLKKPHISIQANFSSPQAPHLGYYYLTPPHLVRDHKLT